MSLKIQSYNKYRQVNRQLSLTISLKFIKAKILIHLFVEKFTHTFIHCYVPQSFIVLCETKNECVDVGLLQLHYKDKNTLSF